MGIISYLRHELIIPNNFRQRGTVPLGKSGNAGEWPERHTGEHVMIAKCFTERIKQNFAIQKLSEEDKKALDDLGIPNDEGRSIDFVDAWGVKLWQR